MFILTQAIRFDFLKTSFFLKVCLFMTKDQYDQTKKRIYLKKVFDVVTCFFTTKLDDNNKNKTYFGKITRVFKPGK